MGGFNHTPSSICCSRPQRLSRVDRNQGRGQGMPLPRRTQRQESYFQAHALGWRDGELEGWLARQLYMKRPASQAQGMPTQLPQAGADGGAAGGQGGAPCSLTSQGLCRGLDFFPQKKHVGRRLTHKQTRGNILIRWNHSCSITSTDT